jgi:hypothetical protein
MGSAAVTGSLFPEMVNPQLAKAQKLQAILGEFGGEDIKYDAATFKKLGGKLLTSGFGEEGIKALTVAKELEPKEKKLNEIGKTPQGLQVYQEGETQFTLKDGKRIPYYGSIRQEPVPPTGTKQLASLQGLREGYLKETSPEFQGFSALQSAKRSLSSLSGIGDEAAKRQLLKASGESGSGLSNKDVQAFANFGDLGQRLSGRINQFISGTYSDEQRKEILALVNQLQAQLESQANEKRNQYRTLGQGIEGVTSTDLDFVAPSLSSIYKSGSIPSGTPAASSATQPTAVTTSSGKTFRILPK